MTPAQIAEDAIWGGRNEDDVRRNIEDAIATAEAAVRAKIVDAITRARRAHSETVGPALLPTHAAFDEGALYAFERAEVLTREATP